MSLRILDLKRCTFLISDGSGTPKTVEVKIGQGNITYEERKNYDYILNRGVLDGVREGDEEPVSVSFEFTWEEIASISGDTSPTVEEALKKIGAASAWVSSDADVCAPYAVDLIITHDPLCTGTTTSAQKETVTIADFRYETLNHDYGASQISCTGRANVKVATVTRTTNSA